MAEGEDCRMAMDWMLARLGSRLGLFTREALLELVESGHMQVWIYGDDCGSVRGVWVTQLVEYPAGRALEAPLGAGLELFSGLDFGLDKMTDFAREMGCKRLVINGRLGWKKVLEKRGWSLRSIQMVKELWS